MQTILWDYQKQEPIPVSLALKALCPMPFFPHWHAGGHCHQQPGTNLAVQEVLDFAVLSLQVVLEDNLAPAQSQLSVLGLGDLGVHLAQPFHIAYERGAVIIPHGALTQLPAPAPREPCESIPAMLQILWDPHSLGSALTPAQAPPTPSSGAPQALAGSGQDGAHVEPSRLGSPAGPRVWGASKKWGEIPQQRGQGELW